MYKIFLGNSKCDEALNPSEIELNEEIDIPLPKRTSIQGKVKKYVQRKYRE